MTFQEWLQSTGFMVRTDLDKGIAAAMEEAWKAGWENGRKEGYSDGYWAACESHMPSSETEVDE